jgi:monothiol glutaredoxin
MTTPTSPVIDTARAHTSDTSAEPPAVSPRPPSIRQISATQLKAMMDAGEAFELIDVRTSFEREIAVIAGSRLLDQQCHDGLLALDRATPIVFACHHGVRSQAAAHHYLREGFRNLHNLEGGIEAWSRSVDPNVPRY